MIISGSLCVLTISLSLGLPDASVQVAVPEVCYQCEGQVCVISQVVAGSADGETRAAGPRSCGSVTTTIPAADDRLYNY